MSCSSLPSEPSGRYVSSSMYMSSMGLTHMSMDASRSRTSVSTSMRYLSASSESGARLSLVSIALK